MRRFLPVLIFLIIITITGGGQQKDPPVWLVLGSAENFTWEYNPILDGIVGQTKNRRLTGEAINYYWITDWGIDCKMRRVTEIEKRLYTPKGELVTTVKGEMIPLNARRMTFADAALEDWCKENVY
jgi:hypothetical protein